MAVSYGILGKMQSDWRPLIFSLLLLLYGFGAGLFVPPNTFVIMGTVSRDIQGTMGSIQRMIQNLGIALYTGITSSFIQAHSHEGIEEFMKGFRQSWDFAAMSLVFGLLVFMIVFVSNRVC